MALASGEEVVGQRRLEGARRHARDLAPAVRELLAEQKWKPRDIDAVIVSRGPGSYTGLRVGIISAKAFAYAARSKLIGVETFSAIALQAPAEVNQLDVFADAQQDRVYQQRWARWNGTEYFKSEGSLVIRPFDDWLADDERSPAVSGPGLRGKKARLPDGVRMVDEESWQVRPESMLKLGLLRYNNEEADDVRAMEPLYLRPSAAEQQWTKLGK